MASKTVSQLYYITHIKNVASILQRGILPHQTVENEKIEYEPIYDASIVATRRSITTPNGANLWAFANLYFQPRNAMLYRVLWVRPADEVVVLGIRPDLISRPDVYISLGNAASYSSEILPAPEGRKAIPKILKWIANEFWTEEVGLKRKMMSECLVPDRVAPDEVQAIFVGTHDARSTVEKLLVGRNIPVVLEPRMFFRPMREQVLTPLLHVADGDMFFSKMQTLTVSVNTVGVMGKGLASRAKYQFPDVYVRYQDVCRARALRMGNPYLYKRESSLEHELADEPATLADNNSRTWFLLFATKRHWRDQSDITGIEDGLNWIKANYRKEGIKSLALPALGCGLGRLDWRDVGPLICRSMSTFDIPVRVYLPAEKRIPDELLSKEFLLGA